MRKARFLEVLAGSLALLLGSTAAFFFSGGYYSGAGAMLFVVISTLLLLAAASVLFLRISAHDRQVAQRLYRQLPAEVACRLKRNGSDNPGVQELIQLAGEHLRSQQTLLDEHYQGLFSAQHPQERALASQVASASEHTWQQLRGELTALEDQFATDTQSSALNDPFSSPNPE